MILMADLKKMTNVNIIDLRNSNDYNKYHLPGAVNYSFNDLLINHARYLDKRKTYYIYCYSGNTSKQLSDILNQKGYKLVNVIGGI